MPFFPSTLLPYAHHAMSFGDGALNEHLLLSSFLAVVLRPCEIGMPLFYASKEFRTGQFPIKGYCHAPRCRRIQTHYDNVFRVGNVGFVSGKFLFETKRKRLPDISGL